MTCVPCSLTFGQRANTYDILAQGRCIQSAGGYQSTNQ